MGQYDVHVFVCTSGDDCPTKANVEDFVKYLRGEVVKAGRQGDVRINKAGCFSQCGHGPMIVVYRRTSGTPASSKRTCRRSRSRTSSAASRSRGSSTRRA